MSEQYQSAENEFVMWEQEFLERNANPKFNALNQIVAEHARTIQTPIESMGRIEKAAFCENACEDIRTMADKLALKGLEVAIYGPGIATRIPPNSYPIEKPFHQGELLTGTIKWFDVWDVPSIKIDDHNKASYTGGRVFSAILMLDQPRYYQGITSQGIYQHSFHAPFQACAVPLVYDMPATFLVFDSKQ